jgi:hypothetical protein
LPHPDEALVRTFRSLSGRRAHHGAMNRFLSIVLVLALVVAGCGSSSSKSSSGARQSEQQSAATGDIPDNQVFLTYKGAGYSLKYPEGWTRSGSSSNLTFRDKGNSVHLVVKPGRAAATSKTTIRKLGPPDPVTGKRPQLIIDRYGYSKGGKVVTLDLATPEGVDNVDAYRLISKSFRWR